MWQYLIPLVVRYLLSTVVKNLPMDQWKAEAKAWVYDTVPGKWFDAAAWAVVEGAWDIILGEVLKQRPKGLASGASMNEAWKVVSAISADVIPQVQATRPASENWKKR
jgi:hypothetical protein